MGLWGPGFSQLCASHVPSHVPSVCPAPVRVPQPQPLSPVLTLRGPSLWSLGEKMHPVLFSDGIQITSFPQRLCCNWVSARQGSGCNPPILPSLFPPHWCRGESWLMPLGHLLQGSPPVPGPCQATPPTPPRVLRITSTVSSRGICRHRQCHPHASLLGTGSICCLT